MSSSLCALLLVLLVLKYLAPGETSTTGMSQAASGSQEETVPSTQQACKLSNTSPDHEAIRSQVLKQVAKEMDDYIYRGTDTFNETVFEIVSWLDRLVQHPLWQIGAIPSTNGIKLGKTISENYKGVQDSVTYKLPLANSGIEMNYISICGVFFHLKLSPKTFDRLLGYQIYSDDEFQVGSTFESEGQMFVFIVYPSNSCPLLPLPSGDFLVKSWKCVDTIRPNQGLQDNPSLQIVTIHWTTTTHEPMLRHSCARWEPPSSEWDKNDCIVVESLGIPRKVSCSCGINSFYSVKSATFILYSYMEDIVSTVNVDKSSTTTVITDAGDISELNKNKPSLENIIALDEYNTTTFGDYLQHLSVVMSFDNLVLVNAFDDEFIKDIGTMLERVKPKEGTSTLGHRNNDLTSFVINLDSYQSDPPIGFGVYKNYEHSIEYYRMKHDMDFVNSMLFSEPFFYSLMFSESVIEQNSRYAFLLYPPDKFFKPSVNIDGHQIPSMRVLDIVLSPGKQTGQDQFVHMFLGKLFDTNRLVGCAYWSTSLKTWTSNDCFPDPGLHDGVCTCNMTANFAESQKRGQYIVFTYETVIFVPRSPVDPDADENEFRAEVALQNIHSFISGDSFGTDFCFKVSGALQFLAYATGSNRHRESLITQVEHESIKLFLEDTFCPLWHSTKVDEFIGFAVSELGSSIACLVTTNNNWLLNNSDSFVTSMQTRRNIDYAFRISLHVSNILNRVASIIYPLSVTLHPVDFIEDHKVVNFRVVQVALSNDITVVEQMFIEIFYKPSTSYTIGCATWDYTLRRWTSLGCEIINVNSVDFCNCSIPSITGGQYIVYSYSTIALDERLFELTKDAHASFILDQGSDFIKNASLILAGTDANLAVAVMRVYHKIMTSVVDISQSQPMLQNILSNLEQAFDHFYADPLVPVAFIYDIPTSTSVKNNEVATEMFSNAVLSSGAIGSEHAEASDFAMAVIGHLHGNADTMVHGIQFSRKNNREGSFYPTNNTGELVKYNPEFACFVTCSALLAMKRFLFAVYSLNLSPYPYTMTNLSMFNSRQVDIYIDSDKKTKLRNKQLATCQWSVQLYFQPTENPKSYIKTGCAAWNKTVANWIHHQCTLDVIDQNGLVSCKCNITEPRVERIIIYEYTDLVNFSLIQLYEGPSVLFIVASSFSLLGFILIATTAILFPTWREELSNKVIMHLASSSFIYLCMTLYRETHLIYADMKRLDLFLVAFTASVHYTRLVHHCWGLVMSVLQYKKFSSVVGASATSHLLLKVSLLAWVVPMVPIIILLSWNLRAHFCSPDSLTHYILYLVPVVIITLLNFGFLVQIIRNMTNGCGLWDDKELQKHGGSSEDVLKRQLKQTIMMFFLFGIPTVFEMFNDIGSHSVALDYVDKMLNPIQGFVMFLFFVIMNDKTRSLWNVHVFGDSPPVGNQPQAKKIAFKPKVPKIPKAQKIASKQTSAVATILKAEGKQSELEIQVATSQESSVGNAERYVVQQTDGTANDLDTSAKPATESMEIEDSNDNAQQLEVAISQENERKIIGCDVIQKYMNDFTGKIDLISKVLKELSLSRSIVKGHVESELCLDQLKQFILQAESLLDHFDSAEDVVCDPLLNS